MTLTRIIFSLTATFSIYSASMSADTVPKFDDVLFKDMSSDNESTIYKVLTSDEFFSPWAYLAHSLGYGWVGGNTNGNTAINNEFDFRRVDTKLDNPDEHDNKYRYVFSGKFDWLGPDGGAHWANKRFRMAFSNIQWWMDPEDIKLGAPELYDKKLIKVVPVLLKNFSDQKDTATAELHYEATVSWFKTEESWVLSSVGITHSFKLDLPLVAEGQTSVTVEMAAGKSWNEMNGKSITVGDSVSYQVTLPPKSQRLITLSLFEQKAHLPYTSNSFISYEAELYNFLRFNANGLNGHPVEWPTQSFYLAKFGGRDGLNAPQDLLSQYLTPTTSVWDWPWIARQYGQKTIEDYIGAIAKRKFRQQFSGQFTAVDSSAYEITAGAATPISGQRAGGTDYEVLGDLHDIAGKVTNLHFSVTKNKRPNGVLNPHVSPFNKNKH